MKKVKIFWIAVVLQSYQACLAEEPEFKQEYNRFRDYTKLSLELGTIIKGSHRYVDINLYQLFKGKGRKEKFDVIGLQFFSDCDDGWVYLKDHSLDLLIDGERMHLRTDHDGDVGDGYVLEFMLVVMSRSKADKIFKAKVIEGQLGGDEFKFNTNQMAAIREFAALVANPERPLPTGTFISPEEVARKKEAEHREEIQRQEEETRRRQQEALRQKEEQDAKLKDKLDTSLKIGKALERTNPKGAIKYYKEIIDLAPDSSQSKAAKSRIKILAKTKR